MTQLQVQTQTLFWTLFRTESASPQDSDVHSNSASGLNPLPSLYRQGLPASLFGAPHRLPRALSSPNSRKMPLRLDIKAEGGDEPLAVDYTFSSSIADHLRAASLVSVMQCQGACIRDFAAW
ncbi:uncharacterized protein LOC103938837 [Pyrus x bretschneideri]|uniref:uncharacterized protein LOC103938837 n=1 Tax=Pyrus x bretschneideri TaxID=225117 RepID=UPI00202F4C49|nr:uncharacterized protein LOC103938837 [Pyrus x bretschneideri]